MADNLFVSEILKGLSNGFMQGMQLKQQKEQAAKEQQFKQAGLEEQIRSNKEQEAIGWAKLKSEKSKLPGTAGEKKLDQVAAADYNAWVTGGQAGVIKNLDLLKEAYSDLEEGRAETGKSFGSTPDFAKGIFFPKSKDTMQKVQSSAVESLKQILGSQFTENDRKVILQLSYDPQLPVETNKKKIQTAITYLENRLAQKEAAMSYFEEFGTLKGFKSIKATSQANMPKKPNKDILAPDEEIINGYIVNHKTKQVRPLNANSNL